MSLIVVCCDIGKPKQLVCMPLLLALGRRRSFDHETVTLSEHGDRVHVHLQTVLSHHGTKRLIVWRTSLSKGEQLRHLREVAFKARRRNNLQRSCRHVCRVPEGVRNAPRLEDEISRLGCANLVSDLDSDLSLQHVGVLVLVQVSM